MVEMVEKDLPMGVESMQKHVYIEMNFILKMFTLYHHQTDNTNINELLMQYVDSTLMVDTTI